MPCIEKLTSLLGVGRAVLIAPLVPGSFLKHDAAAGHEFSHYSVYGEFVSRHDSATDPVIKGQGR